MAMASESQSVIAIMAPNRLYSIALEVTRDLPEAHWLTRPFRHARFKSAVDKFVDALYTIDTETLKDEHYLMVERATQIVAKTIEIHMLTACDVADCQVMSESVDRLRAALIGLEQGLAIDPLKRPSIEGLFDLLVRDLEQLDIQSLSPQIPLLRR